MQFREARFPAILMLVEPQMSGIGGSAWITVWRGEGRPCLVVGAGTTAESKIASLLEADGRVRVVRGATVLAADFIDLGKARADFSAEEIHSGQDFHFVFNDKTTYRGRVTQTTKNRIAFSVENLTPLKLMLVSLFHPGDIKFFSRPRCFLGISGGAT